MTRVKGYTKKDGTKVKGYNRKSGKSSIPPYPYDKDAKQYPLGIKPPKTIEVEGDTYTLSAASKYGLPYDEAKYHAQNLIADGYWVRYSHRGNYFHVYARKPKKK